MKKYELNGIYTFNPNGKCYKIVSIDEPVCTLHKLSEPTITNAYLTKFFKKYWKKSTQKEIANCIAEKLKSD